MKHMQLKDDFYWIGVQDKELKVFDIIMETEFGTTYNSYLLKTDNGVVLFESVKVKFFDEYLAKINEIASVDEIKYIVCNHTEPDHSGSIERLLELNPEITMVSSMMANRNLKEITNREFKSIIVKGGDTLDMKNKTIRFVDAINLHWPDTMYSYIEENQVLITCDSFGCHYATENMTLSNIENREDYEKAFSYYTDVIMGPFKPFMLKAMDRIKDLPIDLIAPGHGPIIDVEIPEMIQRYVTYATPKQKTETKVVIPFVSAYGYTKEIAEIIQATMNEKGIDCEIYDLVEVDNAMVIEKMKEADAILYGSSTILSDALPPIFEVMNALVAGFDGVKKVSAFGSYGWSGEAVPNLLVRLKQQKMKVVDEGFRVLFKPSEAQREEAKAYALNFIEQL